MRAFWNLMVKPYSHSVFLDYSTDPRFLNVDILTVCYFVP